MSISASKPETQKTNPAITRDSMRILGEKSANDSLEDLEGCFNPAVVFEEWRAHCLAELVEEHKDQADFAGLLTAWELGFDSAQPLGLAPKEIELLKAYRLADERGRESIYDNALSQAEDWPRYMCFEPCPTNAGVA